MRARAWRAERGGLEVVELISGAFAALILVFMISQISQFGQTLRVYLGFEQQAMPVHSALAQMDEEAASANAIFIPPTDVLGQSNADGHEFDVLLVVVDAATKSNHAQFIAYRWDAASKTLQRWTYLHHPGNTPTQTSGFAVSATSFSAEYVPISQAPAKLSEAAFLASVNPQDVALLNMGYPGVDAGNREVHIAIANAATAETDDLVQGNYATQVNYVVGTFTPTPGPCPSGVTGTPPSCKYPIVLNPNPLTFSSSGAQTFTASEQGYSGAFSVPSTSCMQGGTLIATLSGTSSTGPFSVAPQAPGTCSEVVSDSNGQTATETITVQAGFQPQELVCSNQPYDALLGTDPSNGYEEISSGKPCVLQVSPTSITETVGQGASISVSEQDDTSPATVASSTCGGIAAISPTSIGGSASMMGTMSGSIGVSGSAPGTCSFVVQDNNPNSNQQATISVTIQAAVANLGTVYVSETWYTNQYTPCRMSEYYYSYMTAATGTLSQVASGSVPIAYSPYSPLWVGDVKTTAQTLINKGDNPSDTATFDYYIYHDCQDLAAP
ncbi:hypothetical protein EPN44_14250 [bacterium]|nr:MAG: hypothetical protein EPN44_14250 [bacterium]